MTDIKASASKPQRKSIRWMPAFAIEIAEVSRGSIRHLGAIGRLGKADADRLEFPLGLGELLDRRVIDGAWRSCRRDVAMIASALVGYMKPTTRSSFSAHQTHPGSTACSILARAARHDDQRPPFLLFQSWA